MDIYYTHPITLKEAINSTPVRLITLDGRTILLSIDEIISPKTLRKVINEGMPLWQKKNYEDHEA